MKPIAILALLLLLPVAGSAATIYVPDQYPAIQGAIDAAAGGDTIIVRPGTYVENLVIAGKSVFLRSERGPDVTVIDGSLTWTVIRVDQVGGAGALIEGFWIVDGAGPTGGGIECTRSTLAIVGNRISRNTAVSVSGGGIHCSESDVRIIGNVVTSNSAMFAGGIDCETGNVILASNVIANNKGTFGGGVAIADSVATIVNNTIAHNTASLWGGGLLISYYADARISNTILWGNDARFAGDEIWIGFDTDPAVVSLEHSVIMGGGKGIFVDTNCTLNAGPGLLDLDPKFVDFPGFDLHLAASSPCRGTGNPAAVPPKVTEDFEGDPRIIQGTVDIGADSFYHHLYVMGFAYPGSPISLRTVGRTGFPVFLGLGAGVQDPPQQTQYGPLWLTLPLAGTWTLGTVPASGVLVVNATVPAGWAPGDLHPFQARIGVKGGPMTRLTNLLLLRVY